MNHAEMKFEKMAKVASFSIHVFQISQICAYIKELHHTKGREVGLGVFRLSHSDLLEEQSYRDDTYDGQ